MGTNAKDIENADIQHVWLNKQIGEGSKRVVTWQLK